MGNLSYSKTNFYVLLVVLTLCSSCSSYRIISVGSKGDFIHPPHSKLELNEDNSTIKKRCWYQYIYLDNLKTEKGNYYTILNLINNAKYHSSKNDITKTKFKNDRFPTNTPISIRNYYRIKYSVDQKAFLLQIDYEKIFTDNADKEIADLKTKYDQEKNDITTLIFRANKKIANAIDEQIVRITKKYEYDISQPGIISSRFSEVAKNLLVEFSNREGTGGGWPTSISQDIVEKIWELLPTPQDASLARFSCQINNELSFTLLNPKISYKVDAVVKVGDENDWGFRLIGTNQISFTRDCLGNIIQNPFIAFQHTIAPSNSVGTRQVLQASTADIQLSDEIRNKTFIGIYQRKFKKNNNYGSDKCADAEANLFDCNSIILHTSNLDSLFHCINSSGCIENNENSEIIKSSYGFRSLITPEITIIINNTFYKMNFNSKIFDLQQTLFLKKDMKLLRLYKGNYKKIKNATGLLTLLPNDKIKF